MFHDFLGVNFRKSMNLKVDPLVAQIGSLTLHFTLSWDSSLFNFSNLMMIPKGPLLMFWFCITCDMVSPVHFLLFLFGPVWYYYIGKPIGAMWYFFDKVEYSRKKLNIQEQIMNIQEKILNIQENKVEYSSKNLEYSRKKV